MRLFTITEDYLVELNKEWILLHPTFAAILRAKQPMKGDYDGRLKLMARKQLAFVYFMEDFTSPIRDMEEEDRIEEALKYVSLGAEDITDEVWTAIEEYRELQYKQARVLQTLDSVKKSLTSMDDYFKNLDFKKTDKMGKLLHSPREFMQNIKEVGNAYAAVKALEDKVMDDLKKDTRTARGKANLGGKEGTRTQWKEGGKPLGETPKMVDLGGMINGYMNLDDESEKEGEDGVS
jgi:hypothetical protein